MYSYVEKLLRQQAALAEFGSFAFREADLHKVLIEASRICAALLDTPFCKISRYRPERHDLLVEAGCGWGPGVVGHAFFQADDSSPHGRAYVTGRPVVLRDVRAADNLSLPPCYAQHGIVSTVNVLIPGKDGLPYGVLEVASVEEQSLPFFLSGMLYDDGVIDPRDTRTVLGICLSVITANRPVEGTDRFGVFRM